MDRQAGLCITLEFTRVLGVVDQDGFQLAISRQVSPKQEGEIVLKCLEAWGRLLLPRDVCSVKHFLPLQARFIHCKHPMGLVPPPPPQ